MSKRISASRTATLNYGTFTEDGSIDVRLTCDHRVMDGATAVRALAHLEDVLHGGILAKPRAGHSTPLKVREIA